MASKVFFANIESVKPGWSLVMQIDDLFSKAGFGEIIDEQESVVVKMHTGEAYCDMTIRSCFIRRLIENVKEAGGIPFVAEATPLYKGPRMTSTGLIESAAINGFAFATLGCPVVCAEGPNVTLKNLWAGEGMTLPINGGTEMKEQEIASAFVKADVLLVCAHAFPSGAMRSVLKHVGMGCATKKGKHNIHKVTIPHVNEEKCIGCGACELSCAYDAIHIIQGKAVVDFRKCHGCYMCWDACSHIGANAIYLTPASYKHHQLRNVESAAALIQQKNGKCGFFSFLLDNKFECECHQHSSRALVPDIGILASRDPVAIDAVAYDLINEAPGVPGTIAEEYGPGTDKTKMWPYFDWDMQLEHAEKLGLGTRKYKLIELEYTFRSPIEVKYTPKGFGLRE